MSDGTKVGITGTLIAAAILASAWQFGGLARAKRSPEPVTHRPRASACSPTRPPGTPRPGEQGDCKQDTDCAAGKNGRCQAWSNGRMAPRNRCTYDLCFTDAQCGAKGTCNCDGQGNYCLSGNCRVDADCGESGFCSPSWALCSLHGPYRPEGFYCHRASDECMRDEDCPKPTKEGYGYASTKCTWSAPLGHWACMSANCPVG